MTGVRYEIVRGIRIQRGLGNEKPELVLLHGLGNSLEVWHLVVAELAEAVPWAAVDIPGFGESQRLADESLSSLTLTLAQLFDDLHWDAPHVAGHSMGGLIAWGLAAEHAHAVGRLTLVSAPPVQALRIIQRPRTFVESPGVAANLLQQIMGASLPVPQALRNRALSSRVLRRVLLAPYVADPTALDPGSVAYALSKTGGMAASRAILSNSSFDLEQLADEVACPVGVLAGAEDRLMTPGDLAWSAEHLRARVKVVRDCGHWPQLEAPDQVAEFILDA